MNSELATIIKERLDKLPVQVATAIKIVPWIETMQNIARTNKLNKEEKGVFATETVLAVLGMVPPKTYPTNLARNTSLTDDVIIKIAKEVDEQIITPILKMAEEGETKKPIGGNGSVLEIAPSNLPMIEKNEVAHTVPHTEKPSLPDYRYPNNKDPYKEPLK